MLQLNARLTALVMVTLCWAGGCSKAPTPEASEAARSKLARSEPQPAVSQQAPLATAPESEKSRQQPALAMSRVISMTDVTVSKSDSCKIDFVYAGFEPEDLFWDGEICDKVTAELVDQAKLERLGKWQRLDEFEKRHVSKLPGGKVLYVGGQFTASIYPVGTTRLSYEVQLAD